MLAPGTTKRAHLEGWVAFHRGLFVAGRRLYMYGIAPVPSCLSAPFRVLSCLVLSHCHVPSPFALSIVTACATFVLVWLLPSHLDSSHSLPVSISPAASPLLSLHSPDVSPARHVTRPAALWQQTLAITPACLTYRRPLEASACQRRRARHQEKVTIVGQLPSPQARHRQ